MKKIEDLRREIKEIMAKPQPWGPMMMPRIMAALRLADDYMNVIQELDEKVKYYEEMRTDAKLSRNIAILKMNQRGISLAKLSKQYGMSKQRIHKIIQTTKKHLEDAHGAPRTEGVSRESDPIFKEQTGSR